MKIRSFAKVNLGLQIEGLLPDGYHKIKTIFQSIDLFDIIEIELINSGIVIEGDRQDIPWDEDNFIYKAVDKFKKRFGIRKGVRIYVEKRIPPGSGLGGGSSNAGCTLIALRKIFFNDLKVEELVPIASEISADTSYFLHGGTCIGEGKGDIIKEIEDIENLYFFLVIPDIKVSSKEAYNEWDRAGLTFSTKNFNIEELGTYIKLEYLRNDLEEVVLRKYEELGKIKEKMMKEGFKKVLMSGSGSCIYGIVENINDAIKSKENFTPYRVEIVKSIGRKEYWERLFID